MVVLDVNSKCDWNMKLRTILTVLFLYLRYTGTIELHELQQVMRKLGQNPTESDLIEMINSVDDNGDNEIDFDEFLILMKSRIGERDPEKELKDAFAVFDTDGSGSIDRKELKRLMKKLGQALTEAELDAMMDEVDTNGDGEISFEEFKAMMVSSSNGWCGRTDTCHINENSNHLMSIRKTIQTS